MTGSERTERDRQFTGLYREHYPAVYAYVARRSSDPEQASQVVAETFTTCWRRLEEASRGGRPWLFKTAGFVLRNSLRSETRQGRTVARLASQAEATNQNSGGGLPAVEALAVRTALAGLPERDQEVLMLTYWDDMPARDAAQVLGCSTATYAVRLHRARARLSKALTPAQPGPSQTQGIANPAVAGSERNAR